MDARSIQTPMLTPTAMPICEVWERLLEGVWLPEVVDGSAMVEDALLGEVDTMLALVEGNAFDDA